MYTYMFFLFFGYFPFISRSPLAQLLKLTEIRHFEIRVLFGFSP